VVAVAVQETQQMVVEMAVLVALVLSLSLMQEVKYLMVEQYLQVGVIPYTNLQVQAV
tara:strand:+ start:492 stop:662 length:171 start_codon:yes stop_codon:yes gene_type:complete